MSIPTFASISLCSRAAREEIAAPDVRAQIEHMPGVDGQFVQPHGSGGRDIRVTGVLEANGASATAAHQALNTSLRSLQMLADGMSVGTYVGTDGASYPECMVLWIRPTGSVHVGGEGTAAFRAAVTVESLLRQLSP